MSNRVALCIGISSYTGEGIDRLANAVPDAELVHQRLIARGFDSELIADATWDDIDTALRRLQATGRAGSATPTFSVIYFAGHGFETSGLGFLLPADFPGPVDLIRIPRLGLSTLQLVDAISGNAGPKLIILDACRSDAARDATASEVTRFNELAEQIKAQYSNAANADDVVFAFATSAGTAAGDGVNGHSRYCDALAAGVLSHNHTLDELLSSVAQKVIRESKMGQRPWYLSSLTHALSFSDLPSFIPVPFEVFRQSDHLLVTRFHPLNGARFVYSIERELLFAEGHERKTCCKFKERIEAIGTLGSDVYVLLESGLLLHRNVDAKDGAKFAPVHRTSFKDAHAVSVSPNGCTIVIVGMGGYEVINRVGANWSLRAKFENSKIDFYNAKLCDDDSAVLCGSSGIVRELTGLSSSGIQLLSQDAQTESRCPVHDIEIVDGGKLVAAVYADGGVEFFDKSTWLSVETFSVNGIARSVAHCYAQLRNGFNQELVELYYRDRRAFASEFPDDPDMLEKVDAALGQQQLLCCSLTKDTRVFAVASQEGFVFLLLSNLEWVAWRVKCGLQPGEANT